MQFYGLLKIIHYCVTIVLTVLNIELCGKRIHSKNFEVYGFSGDSGKLKSWL